MSNTRLEQPIKDDANDSISNGNIEREEKKKVESPVFDILHELNVLSGGHNAENLECPPPLTPYLNRIVRNPTNTSTEDRMIPKIMHFSMKSRCVPRDLLTTLKRWEKQLPEHSIFFHDDDAVDRLLALDWHEFPQLQRGLKCVIYRGAMTIDIWRVLVLWKYGGLYSDIDNWPEDMFTESLIPGDTSAWFLTDRWFRPSQWFMALQPRHPMLYEMMTEIIHNLLNISNIRRPRVVKVTGPEVLAHAYRQFLTPLSWEKGKDAIERFNVMLVGKQNKTVMKVLGNNLSDKNFSDRITKNEFQKLPRILTIKKGYSDVVAYNETLNMTRHDRIVQESGVLHWEKHIYKNAKNNRHLTVSCQKYLGRLEKEEAGS